MLSWPTGNPCGLMAEMVQTRSSSRACGCSSSMFPPRSCPPCHKMVWAMGELGKGAVAVRVHTASCRAMLPAGEHFPWGEMELVCALGGSSSTSPVLNRLLSAEQPVEFVQHHMPCLCHPLVTDDGMPLVLSNDVKRGQGLWLG